MKDHRQAAIEVALAQRDQIGPDMPLRLEVAAALAYPDGSMTASGLRREARRGRLAIERTAGKDYTTLAAIDRMRELCRLPLRNDTAGDPAGNSSSTVDFSRAKSAAAQSIARLRDTPRDERAPPAKMILPVPV